MIMMWWCFQRHLEVILRDDLDEEVWSESKPESSPSSRLSPLSPGQQMIKWCRWWSQFFWWMKAIPKTRAKPSRHFMSYQLLHLCCRIHYACSNAALSLSPPLHCNIAQVPRNTRFLAKNLSGFTQFLYYLFWFHFPIFFCELPVVYICWHLEWAVNLVNCKKAIS